MSCRDFHQLEAVSSLMARQIHGTIPTSMTDILPFAVHRYHLEVDCFVKPQCNESNIYLEPLAGESSMQIKK